MKSQYSFFLSEAFRSNYWMNSKGNFTYQNTSNNVKELIDFYKNKKFIPDYKSKSSYYLLSPDKTKLVRISDHWSDSNIKNVKKVGKIGSCYWTLTSNNGDVNVQKYQSGICEMIKLRIF